MLGESIRPHLFLVKIKMFESEYKFEYQNVQ